MRNIDWPLAIVLVIVFVVSSVVRWRYFKRRAERRKGGGTQPPD
jgi:membrane protein implicated in regulation of membrane protease activity